MIFRLTRVALLCVCAVVVLVAAGESSSAYISIRVPVGSTGQALPVRWDLNNLQNRPNISNGRILYEIDDAGCADSAGFQGSINEFEAIQNSFANWRNVNESEIDFEFAGSTTNAVTAATDNRNVIRWKSSGVTTGVFAVTITSFDTVTGEIVDADMELNDRDFTWDTLGPTGTQGVISRAMIENVVTHEIGHVLGFDHPQNSLSTMFFGSSPGLVNATTLEDDDKAILISDYTNPGVTNPDFGTVQGSVTDGSNPQFGVYVTLVDVATGRNVVGHVTEGSPGPFTLGTYEINGVPPGNYFAYALPVDRSRLGTYYQTAFSAFYPVVHGVAVDTVGTPTYVSVGPGATVTGVDITLPGVSQNPFEPDDDDNDASAIASGEVAVSSISPTTDQDWYSFTTTQSNQQVTIRVLSDVFGSSLNPTLTLFDTNGSTVLVSPEFGQPEFVSSANDVDDTAFDLSGVNFDAEIVRTMATPGTYFFKVESRVGATGGRYIATLEISGIDVTADTVASTISASAPGVAANSGGSFNVTVTPRNVHDRDLNAPNTYTVELLDVTGGSPVVLQTIASASTPFNFTVNALTTAQVVRYGATIDSVQIDAEIEVSHYGTLSTTNSHITLLEDSLSANGYDRIPIMVELRDGANNPFPDSTATVTLSTTAGTLDNGTTTGASSVVANFDSATGNWFIELVAPTNTGTATITAFANTQQIDSKQVDILARATGTGGGPSSGGGGGDDSGDDDDGGGCVVNPGATFGLLLLAGFVLAALRRKRLAH